RAGVGVGAGEDEGAGAGFGEAAGTQAVGNGAVDVRGARDVRNVERHRGRGCGGGGRAGDDDVGKTSDARVVDGERAVAVGDVGHRAGMREVEAAGDGQFALKVERVGESASGGVGAERAAVPDDDAGDEG